jgi:hypothetical protein
VRYPSDFGAVAGSTAVCGGTGQPLETGEAAQKKRGLRGRAGNRAKAVECGRVGDEVASVLQADAPGDAAQVHETEPGGTSELQNAERPFRRGCVRASLKRQHLHGHGVAIGGGLSEAAKLFVHHCGAADLLVQRGLADNQVHGWVMLAQDGVLPGHDGINRAVSGYRVL